MSVSTDALFFFGICFADEDHEWPWQADPDAFPCIVRDENGDCIDPSGEGHFVTDDEVIVRAAGLEGYITVGTHCSQRCPMGYIAIPQTFVKANRGYPRRVDDAIRPTPRAKWKDSLQKFCAFVGYDYAVLQRQGRVGWWLCSDTDMGG